MSTATLCRAVRVETGLLSPGTEVEKEIPLVALRLSLLQALVHYGSWSGR
jgi:hypothetical protein